MSDIPSMAALDWRATNLTGAGEPSQVTFLRASGTLFDAPETPIAMGRRLTRDDGLPDHPAVVVITDEIWKHRLSSTFLSTAVSR